MAVGLRASVPSWLLARGSLSSLSCGHLLRAADNLIAGFLRVRKKVKERKCVCVCVRKRDPTVLYNLVSQSDIHLCLYSIDASH